jgi:hypothetical protein
VLLWRLRSLKLHLEPTLLAATEFGDWLICDLSISMLDESTNQQINKSTNQQITNRKSQIANS